MGPQAEPGHMMTVVTIERCNDASRTMPRKGWPHVLPGDARSRESDGFRAALAPFTPALAAE
jgi:hypothetical protein